MRAIQIPAFLFVLVLSLAAGMLSPPAVAADVTDVTGQKFPDILAAKVQVNGADSFNFDVTVSSPYDTPQRYADAFRVLGADGAIYGERTLLSRHANA